MARWDKIREKVKEGDGRGAIKGILGKLFSNEAENIIVDTILGKENNSPEAKENEKLKAQIALQKEQNRLAKEKLDLEAQLRAEKEKAEQLKAKETDDAQAAKDAAEKAELEKELKEQEDIARDLAARQKAAQDAADAKAAQDAADAKAAQDAADTKVAQDVETSHEDSSSECALPIEGVCADNFTLLNGCCVTNDHTDL